MKTRVHRAIFFLGAVLLGWFITVPTSATAYPYKLYKNSENFGILVFPEGNLFDELDQYIVSLGFEPLMSGQGVMRYGTKHENQTFMMPESVQKELQMEMFITLQIRVDRGILVGIYHPEWGLTLPSPIYDMDSIQENIPKTLDVFRGISSKGRKINRVHPLEPDHKMQNPF